MTQEELTVQNLGSSLDDLMNLDPRGYGVCKILYAASRKRAGEAVSAHFAKALLQKIKTGDTVYILVGFVLRPFGAAETDGIIGAMFLARTLYLARGAKVVLVCQEENVPAVKGLARLLGFHTFEAGQPREEMPFSFTYCAFSKDKTQAKRQSEELYAALPPVAAVTVEAPGANEKGEYHNAVGLNITALEAKIDVLFSFLQKRGVPLFSVGDLGNEMGMGALKEHLRRYVPYTGRGGCNCGCGGGIEAETAADYVLTATTSDWGCYAVCAMIAYLAGDIEAFWDADTQAQAMQRAADCGMIDMYGQTIPAIDGIGKELNCAIVTGMRECVRYAMKLKTTCAKWFEKTIEKGFFEKKETVDV